MTHLKALLIDMDGTLADSLPHLYHFYQTFLATYGKRGSQEEFRRLNGPTLPEVIAHLKRVHTLEEPSEALLKAYEDRLIRGYAEEVKLAPGAKETFVRLKTLKVQLGLVTAAKKELAEIFLKAHHIEDLFAFICSGDHLAKGKPHPEIYEKAFQHVQDGKKQEICVVEDSENGIKAATAAGFFVIQIDLEQKVPGIAHNWKEIYQLLKKHYGLPDYSFKSLL